MTHSQNWRNEDTVMVGWINRPELGNLRCDVIERWPNPSNEYREPHTVRFVSWARGKLQRVSYSHSEERYVFSPVHPTWPTTYVRKKAVTHDAH